MTQMYRSCFRIGPDLQHGTGKVPLKRVYAVLKAALRASLRKIFVHNSSLFFIFG